MDKVLLPLLACVVLTIPAYAVDNNWSADTTYCLKLADYAQRYLQDAGDASDSMPDFEISGAKVECYKGNTAVGIAILEKKIRSKGFTLPAR